MTPYAPLIQALAGLSQLYFHFYLHMGCTTLHMRCTELHLGCKTLHNFCIKRCFSQESNKTSLITCYNLASLNWGMFFFNDIKLRNFYYSLFTTEAYNMSHVLTCYPFFRMMCRSFHTFPHYVADLPFLLIRCTCHEDLCCVSY